MAALSGVFSRTRFSDHSPDNILNFDLCDLNPKNLAKEIFLAIRDNYARCLTDNYVFLSELYDCLGVEVNKEEIVWKPDIRPEEQQKLRFVNAVFQCGEYKRVQFAADARGSKIMAFLHFWSRLRKAELDARGLQSANNLPFSGGYDAQKNYLTILTELEQLDDHDHDGYLNYLRARINLHLRRKSKAREALLMSLNQQPCNWMAWMMLQKFVSCKEHLAYISAHLSEHWLKRLFMADVKCSVLPLAQEEDITGVYDDLLSVFKDSSYILAQMAIAQQNQRQIYSAIQLFERVRGLDPYRLQHLDVFSNLLYVRGAETELTHLAHFVMGVNKYCKETCAVVANFLALRGDHEKAVEYYRRALKLDPEYSQGWTLMGHECVEIKDKASAIEAYRQATNINENDYYAWYGLGQLFEVFKMPFFALRYHQRAHALRPSDSRIIVAMGDCYRKIGELDDAKKCYYKAYQTGDIEGMVLHNLAKLHEEQGEQEIARECYKKFLEECEERRMIDVEELGDAFLYLARAHLNEGNLDDALVYAQKCFIFGPKREESKMVIKEIAAAREKEGNNKTANNSTLLSSNRQINFS